nr:MAG TPA_asm: HTH-type transcriptional regulator [Bacteriophage sp.]
MTIVERILQFIEYKGITKYEFHKKNGFSNGFLDKSRAIGTDKCAIILENYPEINPEWLITGIGEMLRNKENENTEMNRIISIFKEAGARGNNFDKLLRSFLIDYFKRTPERFKEFEQELKEYEVFSEEKMYFIFSLNSIIEKILMPEGDENYNLIKKDYSDFIKAAKEIEQRIKGVF